jgi:hypothetical protein
LIGYVRFGYEPPTASALETQFFADTVARSTPTPVG